jgi:hypothetical protein
MISYYNCSVQYQTRSKAHIAESSLHGLIGSVSLTILLKINFVSYSEYLNHWKHYENIVAPYSEENKGLWKIFGPSEDIIGTVYIRERRT